MRHDVRTETLQVCAPIDGRLVELRSVPDPAFAQGLVGSGLAIDPVGEIVVAPCAGIIRISSHAHAFTVETMAGDVLVHVGIDTVTLSGEGFERLVEDGASVRLGDPILRLDLDRIAKRVPSLITPIIAVGLSESGLANVRVGGVVRCGEPLYRLAVRGENQAIQTDSVELSLDVRIRSEHGLHARPAATLAAALAAFQSTVALEYRGRRVNARSVTALMSLATARGDQVRLIAQGADASDALAAIHDQFDRLTSGGEIRDTKQASCPIEDDATPMRLTGRVAVRGAVMGTAHPLTAPDWPIPFAAGDPVEQTQRLQAALENMGADLGRAALAASGVRRSVLDAHAAIVTDPDLFERARQLIYRGHNAAGSWRLVCREAAAQLQASRDQRMSERASDVLDIEQRVVGHLLGHANSMDEVPVGAVILADDLLPSQLLGFDRSRVAAIVTAQGGTTAHVAILAAGWNLPMVVSAGDSVLSIKAGTVLLVDADNGIVEVAPTAAQQSAFLQRLEERAAAAAQAQAAAQQPAVLLNGEVVVIECNIGHAAEADMAVAAGAEGVGLLRTEFLFLERDRAPSADEQRQEYEAVTGALGERPVTIRLLDVGGDKPLSFMPFPAEENPALGLRGLRTGFAHPELLETQLSAILATTGNVRVLLPMVNDITELRAVRQRLAQGHRHVAIGVMIETPASALLAEGLAGEADFFSIGSNDLSQYVLAIDRLHPTLGAALDGLHPAVIRAMRLAVDAGRGAQRPVAVCGGLAGDLEAVPILIGLGIRELSVAVGSIAEVKAAIRRLDPVACQQLALQAMADPDAPTVRARVREFRRSNGR